MKSFRDFVREDLLRKLLDDVKDSRIFNEADLQYRAAYHLDREYYPRLYLTNQPTISIGRARGTTTAKPDIVIYHDVDGPVTAFELKCFLKHDRAAISLIASHVWRDLEKLRKFKARYQYSKNAFAVVFLNVADGGAFRELRKELTAREDWMSHYLFIHVVNVFCDDNGRKRPWYDRWQEEMNHWKLYFAGE